MLLDELLEFTVDLLDRRHVRCRETVQHLEDNPEILPRRLGSKPCFEGTLVDPVARVRRKTVLPPGPCSLPHRSIVSAIVTDVLETSCGASVSVSGTVRV